MLKVLHEDQFDELFQIIEESFPIDEYRPYPSQRALLSQPHYRIFTYEKDQELAGFLATWEGPEFIFIEHFAVKTSFRNGGLGSKLLQEFLKQQTKPVILEIEPPEGELEKRRANFYKRNGFNPNPWSYLQPALAKDQSPVPLVIMSYPEPLEEHQFQSFKDWVYTYVYSVV
ncbi:GNAT family N-acetyltransferase [Pallidibacillus pasinlerensis]|uniref:GNAT family N-acetyltransferase n=1 Tax=Pallidibacillus pasinlerensis TaxID=2703818 RepID=A0ABX0A8F7_9BACI|nr:GNAT family N-acetyltransferase [Pallidibacillus pasinlerensis]NCU18831.1 GNAT family N-acetyltransferase [Pallidibacillus pasinlerensis]